MFAGDAVVGGNGRVASVGDDINQSGLIDVGCQVIARRHGRGSDRLGAVRLTGNVDAAIAQVRTGQVRTDGAILGIGTIANTTAQPFVGQRVKKSGRTTGFTRSSVSRLNATITVGYTDECAGGSFNSDVHGPDRSSTTGAAASWRAVTRAR